MAGVEFFSQYIPPAFKEATPSKLPIPIATLDPTKVAHDDSISRMRKSYNEARQTIQSTSYDKMGDHTQRHKQAQMVDIKVGK